MDRTLAMCEQEGIQPELFLQSIAETMGWFCHSKGLRISPGMLCGAKAVERYNRWLERTRRGSQRGDIDSTKPVDIKADLAFVEVYGAVFHQGHNRALQLAKQAARSVRKKYKPSRCKRTLALCDYLHRIRPDLPDRLVLPKKWKLRDVMSVVYDVVDLR